MFEALPAKVVTDLPWLLESYVLEDCILITDFTLPMVAARQWLYFVQVCSILPGIVCY